MKQTIWSISVWGWLILMGGIKPALMADDVIDRWSSSLIKIEVTRHQYEYFQPWSRRTASNVKFGVVTQGEQIITAAEDLFDQTTIRVQKGGRGEWFQASLEWIDYHLNLALLKVQDPAFWDSLQPVEFADPVPATGEARLLRWNDGRLENRKLDINRLRVGRSPLSFIDLPQLELDSEIEGIGRSEAIVVGDQLIGLAVAQARNKCAAIPSFLIHEVLTRLEQNQPSEVGFFNFYWKKSENPAAQDYLKLTGPRRGVIITEIIAIAGHQNVLKAKDILLSVDGFDIDIMGDYDDPTYGKLTLERLATRGHWAGDQVAMTLWREGALLEVAFELPRANYQSEYVPTANYDMPPAYLMAGGLLFQPLTEPFLRSWGRDWERRAPVRLVRLKGQAPSEENPSCVVLSAVLPDPYNLGYQDYRYLVVHQVNGRRIVDLPGLKEALELPVEGFHLIEFLPGEAVTKLVLDAQRLKDATQRVMFKYRLPTDYVVGESGTP